MRPVNLALPHDRRRRRPPAGAAGKRLRSRRRARCPAPDGSRICPDFKIGWLEAGRCSGRAREADQLEQQASARSVHRLRAGQADPSGVRRGRRRVALRLGAVSCASWPGSCLSAAGCKARTHRCPVTPMPPAVLGRRPGGGHLGSAHRRPRRLHAEPVGCCRDDGPAAEAASRRGRAPERVG